MREGNRLISEIRKIDFSLDKCHQKKFKTEESILKTAEDHLITDKATAYRLKLLNKSQERRRNVDLSLSKVQNQLASSMLEVEKLRSSVFNSKSYNSYIKSNLNKAENKSSTLENDLKKMHSQIEIKMKLFEKISNKIDIVQQVFGDAPGSPTEIKVNVWHEFNNLAKKNYFLDKAN